MVITDLDIIILVCPQQAPASRTRTDRPAGVPAGTQCHRCQPAALAASLCLAGWGRRRAQPLVHAPEQS